MAPFKIALLQSDICFGDPVSNRQRLGHMMKTAMEQQPDTDLLVLPELWNTGYDLQRLDEIAEPVEGESYRLLADFAAEYRVNIVGGSIAERRESEFYNTEFYNTMYCFDRTGHVKAAYSKIHLFGLMHENDYLQPGKSLCNLELDHQLKAGAAICYDIRFPELSRTLAMRGAQLLIVAAEWPHPRLHHWKTLLTARAIENQMFVIACNRVGSGGGNHFCGHSLIIDPWGEIQAEGSELEEIVTGIIEPEQVSEVRSRIPVWQDRRDDLYYKG
ncbi:carbon-nitrogen family hydrolase [Paenibacillus sp. JX-17]|uniref:Carbon-nitrogen family hydrolase n=1 Tax=Paenibacillus lacisoli TaxID=3064525 RepID=A0ABT9C6W1_9BACL|nr:carbon-nitrogen family hydrolase [Paenibacillus sp. JX-17]MDO7905014.1 carbon-nitrogen family hydrolase [Paenibacillus sp. JX-17]